MIRPVKSTDFSKKRLLTFFHVEGRAFLLQIASVSREFELASLADNRINKSSTEFHVKSDPEPQCPI
jgi:hypothetical protein